MANCEKVFCPEEILKTSGIKNPPFNNNGAPIWMDFSPGSYIDEKGNKVYKTSYKCEYVDKQLVRELFQKFIMTGDNKYCAALQYWLDN